MVSKLASTQLVLLAAEMFERLDDADLGELALRRLGVEPAEELCQRDAVELVRLLHAADLGVVLFRLGQQHRVALVDEHGVATPFERGDEREGRSGRVDPDALVGGAELFELGRRGSRRRRVLPMPVEALWRSSAVSLPASTKSVGLPVRGTSAKPSITGMLGTSRPRMLNSQLIDSGRVSTTVSAFSSASVRRRSASFSAALRPARLSPRNSTGAGGRLRPVGPDRIDEVGASAPASAARRTCSRSSP